VAMKIVISDVSVSDLSDTRVALVATIATLISGSRPEISEHADSVLTADRRRELADYARFHGGSRSPLGKASEAGRRAAAIEAALAIVADPSASPDDLVDDGHLQIIAAHAVHQRSLAQLEAEMAEALEALVVAAMARRPREGEVSIEEDDPGERES